MRRLTKALMTAALVAGTLTVPLVSQAAVPTPAPATGAGQDGGHAAVAVGDHHICALNDAGQISCWGADDEGQSSGPREDEAIFTAVSAAGDHTCALTADSAVTCWGDDSHGQVSSPDEIAATGPVVRQADDGVAYPQGTTLTSATVAFTAGDVGRSVIVPSGGNRGIYAVTAFSSATEVSIEPEFPVAATGMEFGITEPGVGTFSQIATSTTESCGIRTDGGISCWGESSAGALLDPMASESRYRDLAVGPDSVCAITSLGRLECWGGASGDGTDSWIADPNGAVSETFVDVAVASGLTCAITADRGSKCWSSEGGFIESSGLAFTQMSAAGSLSGAHGFCTLANDSDLACSGSDDLGQSSGPDADSGTFVSVAAGPTVTCAVATSGSLRCWGDDSDDQISQLEDQSERGLELRGPYTDGVTQADTSTFTSENAAWTKDDIGRFVSIATGSDSGLYEIARILDPLTVQVDRALTATTDDLTFSIYDHRRATFSMRAAAAGAYHTCAIDTEGQLSCFGRDLGGAVSKPNASSNTYVEVASGRAHTCAVRSNGTLDCWGTDTSGSVDEVNADERRFTSVSASRNTTCAITSDGQPACWGQNTGGSVSGPNSSDATVLEISVGDHHTCALTDDGDIRCWGSDTFNEVDGPNAATDAFVAVAAGWYHTCALDDAGDIQCWGDDSESMVAGPDQSTESFRSVTVGVHHTCGVQVNGRARCWGSQEAEIADVNADPDPVSALSAGWYHTCGVLSTGSVRCWGQDDYGQTGETPGFAGAAPTRTRALTKLNVDLGATGTPTPTVSLATGVLPRGLSLTSDGHLKGTPKETGRFQGTIEARSVAGAAALPFDLTVKRARSTVHLARVGVSPKTVTTRGTVEPGKAGLTVRVSLQKKRAGTWVELRSKAVKVRRGTLADRDRDGRKDIAFRTTFTRPKHGAYRIVARLTASRLLEPSSDSRVFRVR